PFINKNNFAGWMLMAQPLAVGYCAARLTRLWRSARPDLRSRLLALSSSDGARALLAAVAALVMAVSIVASLSRSGMIALAVTIIGMAWFAPSAAGMRRPRRVRIAVALLGLLILAGVAGSGTIKDRFED